MGEDQFLVDPGSARQIGVGELSRRKHDLPVFSINRVTVVVDIGEFVVRSDLLKLTESLQEGRVVPEPDIPDGRIILLDLLRCEGVARVKGSHRNSFKVISKIW